MTDDRPPNDRGPDAALDASKASVFELLRPSPRFFVFMAVTLVAGMSVAAREVARLKYATDAMGRGAGIGVVGAVFAFVFGVSGLLFGRIVDVRSPRHLYVGSLAFSATLALVNAWVLSRGVMPAWWVVTTTVLEGLYFGIAGPAAIKLQASMVGPSAKGAAEIVSILRLGIGGIIGTVLAGLSDRPGPILVGCAIAAILSAIGVDVVARPVVIIGVRTRLARFSDVRARLREVPWIRPTIVADLVLAFALPTQFVALVIVDRAREDLLTVALTTSLAGVLVGRLLLTFVGFRGDQRRNVLVPYVVFVVMMLSSCVMLIDDWVFDHVWLMGVALFIGSALMTYAQSATAALIQQQVPDDVRGALSGAMNAGRNVLIAISGALVAAVTVASSAIGTAVVLAAGMVAGLVVTRGFKGIRLRD